MSKTTEEKIDEMHDTLVRLEAYLKKIDRLECSVFNEGWGIAAQVKVLWVIIPAAWAVFLLYVKTKI